MLDGQQLFINRTDSCAVNSSVESVYILRIKGFERCSRSILKYTGVNHVKTQSV
jgi:hypothetical protein